jgi:hypothetical protein
MNELALKSTRGSVTQFRPEETRKQEARTDALMDFAKKTKDWPTLEVAVDQKIEDQTEFVRWWDEKVRPNSRPISVPDPRHLSVDIAEDLTGIDKQQVSKWRKRLQDIEKYRAALFGPSYKKAMGELASASELVQQSLSNEHYTPKKYIEAARNVLGVIDLDPASCEAANETVKAKRIFTTDQSGLKNEWQGRIWLNPPYGGLAGQFITKLGVELETGNVTAAIVLLNSHCTDAAYFKLLWDGLLCFTNHRINFDGDGTRSGSTHGSVFVYFGSNKEAFIKEFSHFGAVVVRAYVQ